MKKTEENIFEIESREESVEFKNIATGRRFFKVGQRVIDICQQEIDRYNYEHAGFFYRLLNKNKYKNDRFLIESRVPSIIRSVASFCIRKDEENEELELNPYKLEKETKTYILSIVKAYKPAKIIDIKTKKEA